jgi:hypothetical protein
MVTPRHGHSAVRLLDGRVLVVGGESARGDGVTSAELYDPATGTWSATANMLRPRGGFPATLLRDGRVLLGDIDDPEADLPIEGAEVYDPASGTWSATGQMIEDGGSGLTATLLHDGKVLVAGNRAQLYDPDSGTWSATGTDNIPGYKHLAILMSDGKVLLAGGEVIAEPRSHDTDAASVYDPVTGTWTAIANMQAPHSGFDTMALLLGDGKVLVYSRLRSEVYDPTTRTWTALSMPTEFMPDPWALLSDGTVLTGAIDEPPEGSHPDACAAAVYDPQTWSLTTGSTMLRCNDSPPDSSFTLLLDGTVLKAGGRDCTNDGSGVCVSTGAAGLYVPSGVSLPPFSFPSPTPPVFPSPTPVPPLLPPAAGPVPPNARSWTVTVDNESSEPATLFVAEDGDGGLRLVGSATPNVVPAGTSTKVTFRFPAKGPDDGWITVNPRRGEGADVGSVGAGDIGMPGKILIRAEGDSGWLGP